MSPLRQRSVTLFALAFALLVGARINAGEPSEIPLIIPSQDEARTTSGQAQSESSTKLPDWVSARAIRLENGSLVNWNLLPPHYQRSYETAHRSRLSEIESTRSARHNEKAEALKNCPKAPTKYFRSNHGRHNDSLTDLTLHSEAVYRGTVRSIDGGFIEGRVGSLVLLEIDKILKAPADRPAPSRILVEYPFADFEVGDMLFCLRPDRTPAVPEIGDAILAFVLYPPRKDGLVLSHGEEIFFETAEGPFKALSLPAKLRTDSLIRKSKTLADIEDQVAQVLAAPGGPSGGAR